MRKNYLIHKNSIKNNHLNKKLLRRLSIPYKKIFEKILENLDKKEDTFHILSKDFKYNFQEKDLIKYNKFKKIAIIGMGGSILGSNAIYHLFKHKIKTSFVFFDNLDYEKIQNFKKNNQLRKVLFIIISKSGNTLETLSNLSFLKILRKNANNIIVISEKKNLLFSISKKYNLHFIEHKKFLGGRYSVLSEVGMIPASLMGLKTKKIKTNIRKYLFTKNKRFLKESALNLASLLITQKYRNIIFLNYSPKLERLLYWCQQLIAESLGKDGKGFFPVVSNCPTDHHSLLQLYLDGPKDKIFYIFSLKETLKDRINNKKFSSKIDYINNKNIEQVKTAQRLAMIKVLKKNKLPFREFEIKHLGETVLGELFSYFILETAIVGKLAKINPFNQPSVEQVKKMTKKILS